MKNASCPAAQPATRPRRFTDRLLLGLGGATALALAGCGTSSNPVSTLIVSWDVATATAPTIPKLCADVGVANVLIDVAGAVTNQFPCNLFGAETFSFASGTYNVQVIGLDSTSHVLEAFSFQNYYVFGQTRLPPIHFVIK
jgi:hypothetical protein